MDDIVYYIIAGVVAFCFIYAAMFTPYRVFNRPNYDPALNTHHQPLYPYGDDRTYGGKRNHRRRRRKSKRR